MAAMPDVDGLVAAAARLLTAELGPEVALSDAVALESGNSVIRVTARVSDSPSQLIVKHVSSVEFDQPDHTGPPSRFLTEWVALDFLASLRANVSPRLIAADRDARLLVVEDLGDWPSLETVLLADDAAAARRGLEDMGRLLGGLHAASRGHEEAFISRQRRVGTGSPLSDSTIDQRDRRDVFYGALGAVGLAPEGGFWDEVVELEALIHEDSPFRSLIHADAGPHNVLLAVGGSRLIDFEFAVYRNALCDVVGPRLGFPQTMATGVVTRDAVLAMETAYRLAVATSIPESEDDTVFHRHRAAAAGHWALNRWAYLWRDHLAPMTVGERPGERIARAIADTQLVLGGFVAAARETNDFMAVADTAEAFTSALVKRWPDLEPGPVYPALRNQ